MNSLNTLVAFTGNTLSQVISLFLLILLGTGSGMLLKIALKKRALLIKDERVITASVLTAGSRAAPLILFTVGLLAGVNLVELGAAENFVMTSMEVLLIVCAAMTAIFFVDAPAVWLTRRAAMTPSKMDDMLAPILSKSLKATVVVLAIVQVAQTLSGKEITSILAGLGIGGLAVALAAQDTIKNFFGSIVLLADKPFTIGDRINIDGHDGLVEAVGMRSTRIRTLDGHLVTIPNGEMANKTIWNISKRPYIRKIFNLGLPYDTSPEKVKEAKAIVEALLQNHEGMNPEFPPRIYFNEFADSTLNLICIFWYHPPAYWDFLAFTENLNLNILTRFNSAGIEFAFPTQTIHLNDSRTEIANH